MLLTEAEVAERLRCSTSKVKRLRLSGKLAYLPGRPVLVDEADLAAYLDSVKRQGEERQAKAEAGKPDECQAAAARARETWLLRQMREKTRRK